MANPEEMYQCQATATCGYIYNPDRGDRKGKIPKGTAFADLPDDWKCSDLQVARIVNNLPKQ